MGKDSKIRLGKRKILKQHDGLDSGYVQPSGKFWKRYFSKKLRKSKLYDGGFHKKLSIWHEWS